MSIVLALLLLSATVIAAMERARRRTGAAWRHAEHLLRLQGAAIEAAANAIFITDQTGKVEWCNAAFTRLTGWSQEEICGQPARKLLRPDEEAAAAVRTALQSGKPWQGEMQFLHKNGEMFVVEQTVTPICDRSGEVLHYVVVQEDVTARRRAEERIHFLSSYDPLTTLPNRTLFRERLQRAVARAQAERRPLAVLFLDLDHFSRANDSLGHEFGDRLLNQVVERMAAAAPTAELMARVGGDEFALLMVDEASVEAAAALAQALVDSVMRPYEVDGQTILLGSGVGITLFPADGMEAATLMKNAETAMARALRGGPNTYAFYSPAMNVELANRRRLEEDLRRAVSRGEMTLYYQPIVALAGRRIVGFEALLRWQRDGEVVGPDRFVPLAEETGLINPIGDWALAEACRQGREWGDAGLPPVRIAVNISAIQIRGRDLPGLVRRTLKDSGLPAGQLEVELTESAVIDDPDAAEDMLFAIKSQGVRLSLDDFGTGYSSLARLKRFPVDKLKIDRSFVIHVAEGGPDAAMCAAIIAMGHGLGLEVVSEGVENADQLAHLEAEGCDLVQGYLFGAPVPAPKAARMLRRAGR
ncbi:MAG: putative bifunctional diguanylate cyclase/phosphodiesterase [Solirubrobacterales bacterium]